MEGSKDEYCFKDLLYSSCLGIIYLPQ